MLVALTSLKAAGGQAWKERDSWKPNLLADCGEPRLLWIKFHSCVTFSSFYCKICENTSSVLLLILGLPLPIETRFKVLDICQTCILIYSNAQYDPACLSFDFA